MQPPRPLANWTPPAKRACRARHRRRALESTACPTADFMKYPACRGAPAPDMPPPKAGIMPPPGPGSCRPQGRGHAAHAARQCGLCTGCYSNHSVLTATTAQALRVAPRLLPQQPTHDRPQPPATARGRAVFASPPRGYGGRSPPTPGGAGGRPPAGQERAGRSRNPALKRTSDGNHRIRTRRQRRRPGRRPARGIWGRDSPMLGSPGGSSPRWGVLQPG